MATLQEAENWASPLHGSGVVGGDLPALQTEQPDAAHGGRSRGGKRHTAESFVKPFDRRTGPGRVPTLTMWQLVSLVWSSPRRRAG